MISVEISANKIKTRCTLRRRGAQRAGGPWGTMQASEPVLVHLKLSAGISTPGYRAALWTWVLGPPKDLPAPPKRMAEGRAGGGVLTLTNGRRQLER